MKKLYCMFSCLQSPVLLVLRLVFGGTLLTIGLNKLMTLDTVASTFEQLAIPFPKISALLAGLSEFLGGLLWVLGLFTRLISIPVAFTMIVAYITAHPTSLNSLQGFIAEGAFLYLLMSILFMAFGAGRFSLDNLFNLDSSTNSSKSCDR